MRRPIGSASAGSACSPPVGMPRSSSARWVRAGSRRCQLPSGCAGQAQVGVPAEGDRHGPRPGRDDRRVERQPAVAGGDGHLDAVRERERRGVDVDLGAEAARPRAGRASTEAPSRPAHQEAVDREPVAVGAERQPVEVDVDAGRPVAAGRQAVGPRGEQRDAERGTRPQRGQAAGQRQVLATARSAARPRSSRGRAGTSPTGRRQRRARPADPGSGLRPLTPSAWSRRRRVGRRWP